MGCLVEFDNEALIDFDWDAQGAVIFDAWRVRKFGRSTKSDDFEDAAIAQACRELVLDGRLVEENQGWFRIP